MTTLSELLKTTKMSNIAREILDKAGDIKIPGPNENRDNNYYCDWSASSDADGIFNKYDESAINHICEQLDRFYRVAYRREHEGLSILDDADFMGRFQI